MGPRKNMGMHVFMENIMSVHVQPPYFCWLRGVGIRSGFSVYPLGVTATSAIGPPFGGKIIFTTIKWVHPESKKYLTISGFLCRLRPTGFR